MWPCNRDDGDDIRQSQIVIEETYDTNKEVTPLPYENDLLLAPIMPEEETNSLPVKGGAPIVVSTPNSQSVQAICISNSGKDRRPNISKRCRKRIFALWKEFKILYPVKPQKKDAGYFIASKINSEFPNMNVTPQQITRVLYNVYQYKEQQSVSNIVSV